MVSTGCQIRAYRSGRWLPCLRPGPKTAESGAGVPTKHPADRQFGAGFPTPLKTRKVVFLQMCLCDERWIRLASAAPGCVDWECAVGVHAAGPATHAARTVRENRLHPTQKPVEILTPLITGFCPAGGLVLDPFCGSGSTLVAAQGVGRAFLGIELDYRHHCFCVRISRNACA